MLKFDSLGNPICPHQKIPFYDIKARCIGCLKSKNCPDFKEILTYFESKWSKEVDDCYYSLLKIL